MQILAHRGSSGVAPENTLPAFAEAIRSGATGIELDVHLSLDQQLVVIHDDSVERTTNGKGLVRGKTVAELKKLDAGSWFNSRYKATRIPTLKEVCDLLVLRNYRGVLVIELKTDNYAYPEIEEKLAAFMMSRVWPFTYWYCSFRYDSLQKMATLDPNAPLDWLIRSFRGNYERAVNSPFLEGVHLKLGGALKERQQVEQFPKAVRIWTVNNEREIHAAVNLPVAGVITKFPDRVHEMLDRV